MGWKNSLATIATAAITACAPINENIENPPKTVQIQDGPTIRYTNEGLKPTTTGRYDSENDVIYINSIHFEIPPPDKLELIRLSRVLRHELGHYWTDEIAEEVGAENIFYVNREFIKIDSLIHRHQFFERAEELDLFSNAPVDEVKEKFEERYEEVLTQDFISQMTTEGIAEYYENPNREPRTSEYPESIFDIPNPHDVEYELGLDYVKPILETYGELGIRYLLQNVPQTTDLSELPKYQRKAMEDLEKKVQRIADARTGEQFNQ